MPTPTRADREERRRTKYALEWRRIDGSPALCVVLDSVASQANRMELALLDAWDRGELAFPMVRVDFTGETHDGPALDASTDPRLESHISTSASLGLDVMNASPLLAGTRSKLGTEVMLRLVWPLCLWLFR